jgi:hypothetical protein
MKETSDSEFDLYPNPTTKQLNLMVDSNLLGSVYTVCDNTGKLVLTGKVNTENTSVELGNLSAGLYLFRMGENFTQTIKVIKE